MYPKFIKFGEQVQTPNRAKFHRAPSNNVQEKRYDFLLPSAFWHPGGPRVPEFTNVGGDVHKGPLYQAVIKPGRVLKTILL